MGKDGVLENVDSSVAKSVATGGIAKRENKMFPGQELSPGMKIDVVCWPEQEDHYMAYLPEMDKLYIFGGAYDEVEKGNLSIVGLGEVHELDHAAYFRLHGNQQSEVGSVVMNLVSAQDDVKQMFKEFVEALYSRPGADYLEMHRYGNDQVKIEHDRLKPGLKDDRFLDIEVGDKGVQRVYLGLVLTELFAYMEMGSHPEFCDEQTLESIGADKLVALATDFKNRVGDERTFKNMLANNSSLGQGRQVKDISGFLLTTG